MAEVLNEFPRRKKNGGRRSIYPWTDWMDGRVWKLTRGVDFAEGVKLLSLATAAGNSARKAGLKIRTTRPDQDTIVLQAYRAVTPVEA